MSYVFQTNMYKTFSAFTVKSTIEAQLDNSICFYLNLNRCWSFNTLLSVDILHNNCVLECQQFTDLQVVMNDAMLEAGVIPCTKTFLGNERWHDMVYQYVMDTKRDI